MGGSEKGSKRHAIIMEDMKKRLSRIYNGSLLLGIFLIGGMGGPPQVEANVKQGEEVIVGVPAPPDSLSREHSPNGSDIPVWEKRFFGEPLSRYSFSKSDYGSQKGARLSLKSPGKLPGIELGVEMHSLGALQTVVPPERLPKALHLQEDKPILLSPSTLSPDYNGGFLRFTW